MPVKPTDEERAELAAICASLPPDRGAFLARFLPGGRETHLRMRDEAIRALAARHYPHLSTRARCHAIETDLIRMQSVAVPANAASDERRAAIVKILQANGGRAIGWRQLFNIIA